ncbi:MAG: SH3 domain-containing protein [Thermodesulfobacteriota bacterium]
MNTRGFLATFLLAIVIALLLALFLASTAAAAAKSMSVQVKKGDLRATPAFLGKIVATLSYGDRVEVLEQKNAWFRVSPAGKNVTGWMHSSALTEKRIVLKAGARDTQAAASGGELALAGKGFNADVEAEFKAQNRAIDFTWIDRMQAMEVPQDRIVTFLKEGGLSSADGGAR